MKIFISYCDNDGKEFAADAANVLEGHGHKAWYFARNKSTGLLRVVDITNQIRYWCDKVLYICTASSKTSVGQWKEIGQWDNTNKQLIVVTIDGADVPDVIDPYIYERMHSDQFREEIKSFVQNRLGEIAKNYEEWNRKINILDTVRATIQ